MENKFQNMKKLFITLLVLFSVSTSAQNHYLGAQAGMNFSSLYVHSRDANAGFIETFSIGLTYDYKMKNGILLGSGLLYERKGFQNEFYTIGVGFNEAFGSPGSKVNYNYLEIPLKAGYQIGKKWTGYFYLGMVPAYLLDANYKREEQTGPFDAATEVKYDITDEINRFELSGLIELGSAYNFNKKWTLFINASYLLGLTAIDKESESPHYKNHRFNISLGVKYALKSE